MRAHNNSLHLWSSKYMFLLYIIIILCFLLHIDYKQFIDSPLFRLLCCLQCHSTWIRADPVSRFGLQKAVKVTVYQFVVQASPGIATAMWTSLAERLGDHGKLSHVMPTRLSQTNQTHKEPAELRPAKSHRLAELWNKISSRAELIPKKGTHSTCR